MVDMKFQGLVADIADTPEAVSALTAEQALPYVQQYYLKAAASYFAKARAHAHAALATKTLANGFDLPMAVTPALLTFWATQAQRARFIKANALTSEAVTALLAMPEAERTAKDNEAIAVVNELLQQVTRRLRGETINQLVDKILLRADKTDALNSTMDGTYTATLDALLAATTPEDVALVYEQALASAELELKTFLQAGV